MIHHIIDTPEHPHPWLVMELVTGGSLADRIAQGPLTVPEAARIGRGVLAALRAAHAAGILHRDVKPGNVLLRPDGTPVLTDFGIAAVQDATALTATGALIGSPEYIAPERIRGEEGNPSSDLWSLGMMLYVAVEGHHPLRRGTTLATLAAVLDEPLPPPTRSGPLGPVLAAVLGRDPRLRPDADQLDRALAAAEQSGTPAAPAPAWAPAFLDTPHPGAPVDGVAHPDPATYRLVAPTGSGYAAPGGPFDALPTDALPTGAALPQPPAPARSRSGLAVTLSVAAVVLAGSLVWALRLDDTDGHNAAPAAGGSAGPAAAVASSGPSVPTGSSVPPTPAAVPTITADRATTPAAKDLLTPDGVRTVVAALTAQTGGTKVKELTVYPGYAMAQVPTADGRSYDWYDYRDGKITRRTGSTMGKDKPVDLAQYDWNVLPDLLKSAGSLLNVPDPTSRYLIIGPDMSDGSPAIRVYLSGDHGHSGFFWADPKGKVGRTFPAE
ncbi:serine/threonine-protein kinase [Streptomyces sp. CB01881]|uniref:serine/threonine-protein kinase n=1 Tax=Streptomyces sp. CB01881 TaxID=2078691 RepID=UPI000CDC42D2|nr:serine/threonine-protein kinase [Streptomyces sp. CB01881]AUY53567.1 serine/threonine protein kinase [Streptomyces sp. CB01881]TYC69711.1 serine/threonine protein kinase [Streptomyces sp. CB01881]